MPQLFQSYFKSTGVNLQNTFYFITIAIKLMERTKLKDSHKICEIFSELASALRGHVFRDSSQRNFKSIKAIYVKFSQYIHYYFSSKCVKYYEDLRNRFSWARPQS